MSKQKYQEQRDKLYNKFQFILEGLKYVKKVPDSIEVLIDCMDVQIKKGSDYQYGNRVRQADYYPNGIQTMNDTINSKVLRINSLIEKYEDGKLPTNESIKDSLQDIINTASFAITYIENKMDGQSADKDFLNREIKEAKPDAIS